jgi:nucleoside-diphosphate-sugar epimerase
MSPAAQPLAADLDHILDHTRDLWRDLRAARIFITGGTGFFGCWLLESFAWANRRLSLNAQAVVLTRNPEAFRRKAPALAGDPAIALLAGDVRSFSFPAGEFPFVIHAATEASAALALAEPLEMLSVILDGTRRTLDFAAAHGCRRLLFTSSGAVYGKQPPDITHVAEDYPGGPDPLDPRAVYAEGKRAAEMLCALASSSHGMQCLIARGFAFAGPYLPLDVHFAIGNFIRDAMRGAAIELTGDGTPRRSYLYAADLAIWLWTILMRGASLRPYNVGSENDLSIAELAHRVSAALDSQVPVRIARDPVPGRPVERYVPSTRAAREELGLRELIGLDDAIRRTALWHKSR